MNMHSGVTAEGEGAAATPAGYFQREIQQVIGKMKRKERKKRGRKRKKELS